MSHRLRTRRVLPLIVVGAISAAALVAPAGAAAANVRCVGTADFCGATVSIAGAAGPRVVTINLTGTNFSRVGVRVIPPASRGGFRITSPSFRLGGSQYRFTLNSLRVNPRGARIILLFAAGAPA